MSQAQSDANAPTALHGLVVLDLTRVRSGPTCVRQLGDWGADVIKIELPEGRGETHDIGGRHNPDFQNLHRNKRSLTLDLKTADGIAILKRMVAKADVVVENYRPDVKHRLGIDYATLAAINPRLIYASISGFGQTGPYSDRPGVDQIAQGMSGLMSVTGEPGRGPMRVGTALADLSAGLFAAMGILLALQERTRSGLGQQVETSLLAAQIFMLDFQAARYLMAGEVAGQAGNNHPTGVPCGPIYAVDQVFADPQVKHQGMAAKVHHEELGDIELVGQPIHMSRTNWRMRSALGPLGEHTDAVLAEIGYTAAEIAALHDKKVI